ncbi:type ISP restriction/modification enzyme [Candidatus Magnetomonas plexicatena]|uniref:type ISP restriction/modification enzyme n=1 Tax=Candidatus Magnetomonas plexicatena TaxID=2552947 RepID=UPI001C768B32|nr:N-6 DNA methylase [Nitrospirales bacterium LBB_01]
MSIPLINQYYSKLDRIIQYGGSRNETSVRNAFYNLLNEYANKKKLELVTEIPVMGTNGKSVVPDGILKNVLRLDCGYWESKDDSDDLDEEINKKFKKGYPASNIIFEDGSTAVLFQQNAEVLRVNMRDSAELDKILIAFVSFEHPDVRSFNEAIDHFKQDIPTIAQTLHEMINEQNDTNKSFKESINAFFEMCKVVINPNITLDDIHEMLIQHILTEEIFISIFSDSQFHHENNIAKELNKLEETFFIGKTKRQTLDSIKNYYEIIKAHATSIVSHHEKQKFLKIIYENFYKAYNPKGADKLGIVYTPNEIVTFMIESTDFLLHKHFNKTLADENVEILDPATGTGSFVCDLIEFLPKHLLDYKYKNEIHANEVSILPYYIANLNIEYTFKQKMGYYEEFKNVCFVDTLDNIGGLHYSNQQTKLFGFSSENAERIISQNKKKISVVIGNPPYNANQMNENDNNKNREYKDVDKRIKDTYIKASTAQKTKLYDMYSRFFRWASDRIDKNGIIAFVTNNSFINSRSFDGFRKCIEDEFAYCYIIDTRSDVRVNPKIAGTTHNVFGIQTGVAVMFLVRKEQKDNSCQIQYFTLHDEQRKEEKLDWFHTTNIQGIPFKHIQPDNKHNWINIADTDFNELLPLINKDVKLGRNGNAVFKLFSNGVVTARDAWVYDDDVKYLKDKINYLINTYNDDLKNLKGKSKDEINNLLNYSIKWTRAVKNDLVKQKKYKFSERLIIESMYRPFRKKKLYYSKKLNEMQYQQDSIFGTSFNNTVIAFSGLSSSKPFQCLAVDKLCGFDFLEKTQCLPLYHYGKSGNRFYNITDWGLKQFVGQYSNHEITKENIFNYVYAVLHNPSYRKKYELNLKRDFPRIPFYEDFFKWAQWGKALMELHINYETAEQYPLKRFDESVELPKVKLKADKDGGSIIIDEQTTLRGIPKSAWDYKLGNRSALEWVLDQYKESKPNDATIAEKFNTYRFSDYKEQVIELLQRVCTVSVETMKIIEQMVI